MKVLHHQAIDGTIVDNLFLVSFVSLHFYLTTNCHRTDEVRRSSTEREPKRFVPRMYNEKNWFLSFGKQSVILRECLQRLQSQRYGQKEEKANVDDVDEPTRVSRLGNQYRRTSTRLRLSFQGK